MNTRIARPSSFPRRGATLRGITAVVLAGAACTATASADTIDASAFAGHFDIMFPGYAGAAPVENFPVLVRLSAERNGFDYAACQALGADLRFADAECRFGSVSAEILGEDGRPVPGFSADDCAAFAGADATKTELRFSGGSLAALSGQPSRIRFILECATLYAFWVSPSPRGESRGYVAAGGPAYPGLRDL